MQVFDLDFFVFSIGDRDISTSLKNEQEEKESYKL